MLGDCREWFWKDDVLGQSADRNAGVRVSWTCIMESGRFGEGKRTHELEPVKRNIRKLPPSSVRTTPPSSLFLPKLSTLPLQLLGFPPGTFHPWNVPRALPLSLFHFVFYLQTVGYTLLWLHSKLKFPLRGWIPSWFSQYYSLCSVLFNKIQFRKEISVNNIRGFCFARPMLFFWRPLNIWYGFFFKHLANTQKQATVILW